MKEESPVVDGAQREPATKPQPIAIPGDVAARMLGTSIRGLQYQARCGRIRRVFFPGGKRAMGYAAADVQAILEQLKKESF